MENLNQKQFDQKFKEIALGEMAHERLSQHKESFDSLAPRATAIAVSCNHCGEDIDVNALYHPGQNTMHFRCPECKKTDLSSNWHDYGTNGRMKDSFTGEHFGPSKLNEHLSKPDPSLPKAPTWKQVNSAKWDRDGEDDDECKHKNIREMYDGTKACTNCYKKF